MGFWKSVGRALADSAGAQAARDQQKAARKETAAYLAAMAAAAAETNKGRRKKLFEQALSLKEKADAKTEAADRAGLANPQGMWAATTESTVLPTPPPVAQPRNCPNCGAPTSAKPTNVCRYCGVDLPGTAAAEQTEFQVILTAPGNRKIGLIKVVHEITGLGLKEAKGVVDQASGHTILPAVVKQTVKREEADSVLRKLENAGASAEIRFRNPGGSWNA
jgi:large subunit ribosomal protein L7/L12